jgi:hypothetical protein
LYKLTDYKDGLQYYDPVEALCLLASKDFKIILLSNLFIMSLPDEGYYRNAPCALNVCVCVFLFHPV